MSLAADTYDGLQEARLAQTGVNLSLRNIGRKYAASQTTAEPITSQDMVVARLGPSGREAP
jgi:hypothetical protein